MKRYFGWMFFIFGAKFLASSLLIGIAFFAGAWEYFLNGSLSQILGSLIAFCVSFIFWMEIMCLFFSWICFCIWYRWTIMPLFEIETETYIPESEIS